MLPLLAAAVVTFDFGPRGTSNDTLIALPSGVRDARFGWSGGMIADFVDRQEPDPFLKDGIEGEDATFEIGVTPPDATWRLELVIGDRQNHRPPVDILVGDRVVQAHVEAPLHQLTTVSFDEKAESGALRFRLRSTDCRSFAIVGARLFGPAGAKLAPLFPAPDPKRAFVPPPDSLRMAGADDARGQLERDGRFIMENRLADSLFSASGAWYQNSFAVRALLAGDRILDHPDWRRAAFEVLDRFVSEQLPDRNWKSSYFGRRGCELAGRLGGENANLADIGSMTFALASAIPLADAARRDLWTKALVAYADSISLPNQLASGAFMNRRWEGRDHTNPYSVATATQASTLALLGAATGSDRYTAAAERAAAWLAEMIRPSGLVDFSPYDTSLVKTLDSIRFGDIYYIIESLVIVERTTHDPDLRDRIHAALGRWVDGELGIRARAHQGYWWPITDGWIASKMAGIPALVALWSEGSRSDSEKLWLRRMIAWLGDDDLARRIGVRAHPASPTGEYAFPATSFAALSAAAFIDPSAVLPPAADLPGAPR